MSILSVVVSCLLLAQPGAPNRSPAPPARLDASAAGPLVPVKARKGKLGPPQLLAQLLTPPENTALAGKPLPLKDVLTRAGTRIRQLEATRSYWNLSAAVAEYHAASQEQAELAWLQSTLDAKPKLAPAHESAAVAMETAAASARLRDAELRSVAAQLELAERIGLPGGDPLPLPLDQSHVGGYRTYFEAKFAARSPAPRLRLIDKSLPIRRKSIEARAEAIQSSQDALDDTVAAFEKDEAGPATLASRFLEVARQRRAFLSTVREYNAEIAEYACATAGANDPVDRLLAMMIDPKPVVPAPPGEPSSNRPKAPAGNDPSPAAPAEGDSAANRPRLHSVLKQDSRKADEDAPVQSAAADQRLFSAFSQATPLKRTQRLATHLHWYRAVPAESVTAIKLNDCLAAASPTARREIIGRFWQLCELAARHQFCADRVEWLSGVAPIVSAALDRPDGPLAVIQLRAAQFAADADLADAEAVLLAGQFDLTGRLPRPFDKPWLLPNTSPHGGRYELRTEHQPRSVIETHGVKELVVSVPKLHQSLQDRAEAVVLADELRASSILGFEAGQLSMDDMLEGFHKQAEQTFSFLSTLTRYNDSIADYVLRVLSPQVGADRLTSALVLQ